VPAAPVPAPPEVPAPPVVFESLPQPPFEMAMAAEITRKGTASFFNISELLVELRP
jgi:hypothetical protein